jgi:hypothetical protein
LEESTFPPCFVVLMLFLTGGRPDVVKLIKEVYRSWDAEIVLNHQGNQEMMEGCKEAEILAFVGHCHLQFDPILVVFVK